MKKNKYLILTILWMIFIFVMSQTPGNDSSKQSNFIVDIIIHILPITRDTLSFIVRKCAHMTEYAILAFLLYKTFIHKQNPLIKSVIFTFLYACSDEFHQLFIAGRAGQFKDVCIDSTGALIMLLIIYFINKRKDKKRLRLSQSLIIYDVILKILSTYDLDIVLKILHYFQFLHYDFSLLLQHHFLLFVANLLAIL